MHKTVLISNEEEFGTSYTMSDDNRNYSILAVILVVDDWLEFAAVVVVVFVVVCCPKLFCCCSMNGVKVNIADNANNAITRDDNMAIDFCRLFLESIILKKKTVLLIIYLQPLKIIFNALTTIVTLLYPRPFWSQYIIRFMQLAAFL